MQPKLRLGLAYLLPQNEAGINYHCLHFNQPQLFVNNLILIGRIAKIKERKLFFYLHQSERMVNRQAFYDSQLKLALRRCLKVPKLVPLVAHS